MKDSDVIDAFLAYLRENGYPGLKVERRPDKENPGLTEIDAIAGEFAIEHTSIDSLPNQRRDSDWYMRVAGGLDQELCDKVPFHLRIVLHYEAVTKGQDWGAIRQALKNWISNEAPLLDDGNHVINITGVPFCLSVLKSHRRRPGIFFGRFEPSDDTLSNRIRKQFDRKVAKLAKHRGKGKLTILLVENSDIALMNELKMIEAIRSAYPGDFPQEVDQIWYADTSIPSEIEFSNFTSRLRQQDDSEFESS